MANYYIYSGALPNLTGTPYAGYTAITPSALKSNSLHGGDKVVVSGSVNENVELYGSAADTPLNVTVLENPHSFTVTAHSYFSTSVNPTVTVTGNATSVGVTSNSGPLNLTVADGASIGDVNGSGWADSITTGNGSHIGNIWTGDGADKVSIGQNGTAGAIGTGSDADTVTLHDGAQAGDIDAGNGDDKITLGDHAKTGNIALGSTDTAAGDSLVGGAGVEVGNITQSSNNSHSSVTLGDGAHVTGYFDMGGGHDNITLGAGTIVDSSISTGHDLAGDDADTLIIGAGSTVKGYINTNRGDDTVSVGDNTTLLGGWDAINTYLGDDTVIIGKGVTAPNRIYTGAGNDTVIQNGAGSYTVDQGINLPNDDVVKLVYKPGTEMEFNKAMSAAGYTFDAAHQRWSHGSNSTLTYKGVTYKNADYVQGVTCFTPGTMIQTDRGPVAVETLTAGDLVVTRDRGLQAIRWIGQRDIDAAEVAAAPADLAPIRIRAGALGAGLPAADLVVSPWHRMVIKSDIAADEHGRDEVLVAAVNLLDVDGVDRITDGDGVTYIHFMCDQHEVVIANGTATESMNIGQNTAQNLSPESYAEILRLFPQLASGAILPLVRPPVRGVDGRTLVRRHLEAGLPLAG